MKRKQKGGFGKKYVFTTKEELRTAIERVVEEDIPNTWNVSAITDMNELFQYTMFDFPIDQWDVSQVTTMEYMFANSIFNQPLPWNTSSVTNMNHMFFKSEFNHPLEWDVSQVTSMEAMFANSKFNQPLHWNTSSVTSMKFMFYNSIMNQPITFVLDKVTTMESMFDSSSFNQDISTWNIHGNTTNMFYNASIIEEYKPHTNVDVAVEPWSATKSITIYIDLHGENISEELHSIANTAVGTSYGLCFHDDAHLTSLYMLSKIDRLKELYQGTVKEGNDAYVSMIKDQRLPPDVFMRNKDALMKQSSMNWRQLQNEYLKPKTYLRSYTYDRYYTYQNDDKSVSMGIFIIDDSSYSPIQINATMEDFTKEKQELIISLENYQELQKRNLMNVQVAKRLLPGGFQKPFSKDYTHIHHYTSLRLSDILHFFQQLGYDHVNILDNSCRGEKIAPSLRRQRSYTEKQKYKSIKAGTRRRFK